MKLGFFCNINRSTELYRLDAGTNFSRGDLIVWIPAMPLGELLAFIDSCLGMVDFPLGDDGFIRFGSKAGAVPGGYLGRNGVADGYDGVIGVPDGYVGLDVGGRFSAIVPLGSFWGFLKVVCRSSLSLGMCFPDHVGIEEPVEHWMQRIIDLEGAVDAKLDSCASQGTNTYSVIVGNRSWGKAPNMAVTFESKPEWMPYLACEFLFEMVDKCGTQLCKDFPFFNYSAEALVEAYAARLAFADALKVARVWGKQMAPEIYSIVDNPGSKATQAILSYHALLEYCVLQSAGSGNTVESLLGRVPFSVDWFHNLKDKLPGGWSVMEFTAACEARWNEHASVKSEVREVEVSGWVFKIQAAELDPGRFGWVRVFYGDEAEAPEDEFAEA